MKSLKLTLSSNPLRNKRFTRACCINSTICTTPVGLGDRARVAETRLVVAGRDSSLEQKPRGARARMRRTEAAGVLRPAPCASYLLLLITRRMDSKNKLKEKNSYRAFVDDQDRIPQNQRD